MANRAVELAVHITADVAGDVAGKFDDVGGAASRMADDVADSAGRGAAGLERMGGASEGLDDKFGRAAGAAGALSSGAELIGNEKASGALMAMALATDFFSGVGQVGTLVTEGLSTAIKGNVIVSKIAAGATKLQAGAQAALNAVMSANPILLVVIAIAALVAGFILAYKHSETFREIVQKVGKAAGAALKGVVGVIGDIIDWLGRVGSKFNFVGDLVHSFVFVVKAEINLIIDVVKFLVDKVGDAGHVWGDLKDKAVNAAQTIHDKVSSFFHTLLKPINTVKDAVQGLLDLIGNLVDKITHLPHPHLPDVNPFNKTATGGRGGVPTGGGVTVDVTMPVTINLPVAGDPTASAQAIVNALVGLANRLGITVLQLLEQNGVAA